MIATNDAVDVLRNGWKDAAGMFLPESPEIAELLEARLEMAAHGGELDEAHLLGAIADVESLAASTGSSSGAAFALRLRRTVYEYLLALDAAPPRPEPMVLVEAEHAQAAEADTHEVDTPLVETPEPAATHTESIDPEAAATEVGEVELVAAADASGADTAEDHEAAWRAEADRDADDDAASRASVPLLGWDDPPADAADPEVNGDQLPLWTQPDQAEPPVEPGLAADGFVAERAGFHIVEETHPNSVPGEGPTAPFDMPAFDADISAPVAPEDTAASPPASTAPAPAELESGWRVRDSDDAPGRDDDPVLIDPKFVEMRHRIEDRLRRKRCDEAAALLQQLAQEPGGRAVAELAMNAGDRCQSLGKSNAALNCFLAASRADPVYEAPLSRLADICIDDQDGDLAVSYLERVARLCKYRGDEKGVLRVYRRIATIAPYREDILQALLNARANGRID